MSDTSPKSAYHSSEEVAIAFGDPRETALYYKRVIPFDTAAFRRSCDANVRGSRVLEEILPLGRNDRVNQYFLYSMTATHIVSGPMGYPKETGTAFEAEQLQRDPEQRASLEQFWDLRGGLLLKEAEAVLVAERDALPQKPVPASFNPVALASAFTRLVRDKLATEPTVIGGTPRQVVATAIDDHCLNLAGLRLVDTEAIKWEHLLEFRRDASSWDRLRSLTTFVYADYQGKSKAFVQDDLSRRIDEYNQTAKAWGLETKDAVLNLAFSKATALSSVAAISAALSGKPITAVIAAGGGVLWALKDIVLTLRKRRRDFALARDANRVRFLVEARSLASR